MPATGFATLWNFQLQLSPFLSCNKYGGRTLHNLAILKHTIAIGYDCELRNRNPGRRQLNEEEIKHWKEAFSLWKKVQADSNAWTYLKERIKDDPQLSNRDLTQLRQDFLKDVVHLNSQIAVQAIKVRWFNYAKQHISLIKESGFKEDIIKEALYQIISPKVEELRRYRKEAEREIEDENANIIKRGKDLKKYALEIKDEVAKWDPTLIDGLGQEMDEIGLLLDRIASIHGSKRMEEYYNKKREINEGIEQINRDPYSFRALQLRDNLRDLLPSARNILTSLEGRVPEAQKLLLETSKEIPLSDVVRTKIENSIKWTKESRNTVEENIQWIDRELSKL